MQIWKLHLQVINSEAAPSCWRMVSWIRHQSRSVHSAAKENSWCFFYHSHSIFSTLGKTLKLLMAAHRLTTIRTRQSDGGKQKMFQCGFCQGGGGDLSVWMWLGGRVWAFFSRFPTVCSEVTAETRHHVSPSPTVSTHSHGHMSIKAFCFEL